ncbi:MAG: DegV family protein [Oscillospiraceae bacterium]|nr:DegV family protein [Oscillospiraceae bacterium]
MSFAIFTDTSANLPTPLLEQLGITAIPFSYYIDGNEFTCTDTDNFDGAAFYGSIRRGTVVSTSLISPGRYTEYMLPALQAGQDILFVGMSSGISGSYGAARLAAVQLREEFPERQIETVDSIGASLGEGLLAVRAAELREEGRSLSAVKEELDALRMKMCQVFTVDDLRHLRRTGRLSNAAAVVATVLNIKPLLKGNENGNIVSFAKVRGRRRSIEAIAEHYDRLVENAEEQTVGIAHADCPEDAELLAELLRRNNPPRDFLIVDYEPVTGSHVGPGALALFFLGSSDFRFEK